MGLISVIKSMLNRSEAVDEVEEEQEESIQEQIIPTFNRGMPIDVMQDYDTVLIHGKMGNINTVELVVERIPGVMSFPILEVGSEVLIRGYDFRVSPIILRAKVVRSTVIECVLGDWQVNFYDNLRKSIRYPLTPLANIYEIEDVRLNNPQSCQLINISTGGACIVSEYCYIMGQMLRLRVELIENSGHTSYQCQVVRVISRKDDQFEYGLLFAQLDQKKKNSLMRDIQTIQKDTEKKLMS